MLPRHDRIVSIPRNGSKVGCLFRLFHCLPKGGCDGNIQMAQKTCRDAENDVGDFAYPPANGQWLTGDRHRKRKCPFVCVFVCVCVCVCVFITLIDRASTL